MKRFMEKGIPFFPGKLIRNVIPWQPRILVPEGFLISATQYQKPSQIYRRSSATKYSPSRLRPSSKALKLSRRSYIMNRRDASFGGGQPGLYHILKLAVGDIVNLDWMFADGSVADAAIEISRMVTLNRCVLLVEYAFDHSFILSCFN